MWTQNSLKHFFYFFLCVKRESFSPLSLSLFFFVFFVDTLTLVCCVCVFETNHNIIITRSAQKQHHHLRFFVVRDERSNNSIFGVCAEKTRASGFGGVFFMSFRAATGVRFDKSSVVLSSALSRHHRHRLGARLVRFLLRLRFPSYERKKERKRKRAPAKRTTGVAGFGDDY